MHNGLDILGSPGFGYNDQGLAKLFAMPVNGYSIASALLDDLKIPKLYSWGNHDNEASDEKPLEGMRFSDAVPPLRRSAAATSHNLSRRT